MGKSLSVLFVAATIVDVSNAGYTEATYSLRRTDANGNDYWMPYTALCRIVKGKFFAGDNVWFRRVEDGNGLTLTESNGCTGEVGRVSIVWMNVQQYDKAEGNTDIGGGHITFESLKEAVLDPSTLS